MNTRVGLLSVFLLLGSGVGVPARASTVKNLSFTERVRQAGLIVRGRVVRLEALLRGTAPDEGRERPEKESASPRVAAGGDAEAGVAALAPESVGIENGSMIFTRVTIEVEEEMKGVGGREVVFEVAGGVLGGRAAIVHGMPRFQQGGRYMLFLRPGYENAGDPVVGVDQGFFEVVRDETLGADVILDAAGDFVVGIENDQVVSRRNDARADRPATQLGPAPVPDSGAVDKASVKTSPEVLRYWQSSVAPMSAQIFRQAILTATGVRQ